MGRQAEPGTHHYTITVRGEVGGLVAAAFHDLTIKTQDGNTVISGDLSDQPHLHGVIGRLGSFGLEIISVVRDS